MKCIICLMLSLICLPVVSADNNATTILVIYDNNEYNKKLETEWGFSCVVRHDGKSFLFDAGSRRFDTGGPDSIFFGNMKKLQIEPEEIDAVMLSNIVHVGGMPAFLTENSDLIAYIPSSFHKMIGDKIGYLGAKVEKISAARKLFGDFYTTGELGKKVKEQALMIDTDQGIVVIVGSGHPGIIEIVEKAKQMFEKEIFLVMGGFNLKGKSEQQIKKVITGFRKLGVKFVGPCHNSGNKARRLFKKAYGEKFIAVGVGKIISISE